MNGLDETFPFCETELFLYSHPAGWCNTHEGEKKDEKMPKGTRQFIELLSFLEFTFIFMAHIRSINKMEAL